VANSRGQVRGKKKCGKGNSHRLGGRNVRLRVLISSKERSSSGEAKKREKKGKKKTSGKKKESAGKIKKRGGSSVKNTRGADSAMEEGCS